MERDLGGTLDKRKKELKSREGKKQKEYMEQRLTTKKRLVGGVFEIKPCTTVLFVLCPLWESVPHFSVAPAQISSVLFSFLHDSHKVFYSIQVYLENL